MVSLWLIKFISVPITSTSGSPLECGPEVIVFEGPDARTGRTVENAWTYCPSGDDTCQSLSLKFEKLKVRVYRSFETRFSLD